MTSRDLSASIAAAFRDAGGDTFFGLPGGGNNLDLIGAVEAAGMRFVLAHAETPAAIMACAYADLTGRPAGCVVTRGPGTASAVNGIANALLDRAPVLLVTDAVSSADFQRIGHQRFDQRALLAPVTAWSATAGRDADAVARHALEVATGSRPGPVHLDFDPTAESTPVPPVEAEPAPRTDQIDAAAAMLRASRRPVVALGGGARSHADDVRALLQDSAAPVLMTYRGKGIVPESSPTAAGLLTGVTTEAPVLEAADLIVFIGVDTAEFFPGPWPYEAPVLSIAAWPEASTYVPLELELVGHVGKLLGALAPYWPESDWLPDAGNRHRDAELARLLSAGPQRSAAITPQQVVSIARRVAPAGTIATVDAGAHMLPAMCLWDTESADEVLISSGLATMGYAVPAAIGAALARPDRRVVAFTGDGGLGMCLGELETIRRLELPITIVVFNDSRLSLISIKAKPEGNGGEGAVAYDETDFAEVGRGYGLLGLRAESPGELESALARALAGDGPAVVDARVDPSGYKEILGVIRGPRDPDEQHIELVR
jgi:acetolactate synthase I/II/III large subunit